MNLQRKEAEMAGSSAPAAGGGQQHLMAAVVQSQYGEAAQVLTPARIVRPQPGAGEVLVRVRAAGVDRGAWHLMTGLPYPVRLAGYGVRRPKTAVRGRECAGTVVAIGSSLPRADGAQADALHVGDEVFGVAEGCFAEYAVGAASTLRLRPSGLTAEQAAALPISGLTALQAVRDHGRVMAGQRVLVIGASGGVGSFAVQLAAARGAQVTGVCSGSKAEMVRTLGASDVIDYTSRDLPGDGSFDVIIDCGGNRPLRLLRRSLTPTGVLVLVGGETGGRWLGGAGRQLVALLAGRFSRGQRLVPMLTRENGDDLAELARLAAEGVITPAVGEVLPLREVPLALQRLVGGSASGKIVISVAGS